MEGLDINAILAGDMSSLEGIDFENIDYTAYDLEALGLADWDPNSGEAP